jgi:hypothetical protein
MEQEKKDSPRHWLTYIAGGLNSKGLKISRILCCNDNFIIYLSEKSTSFIVEYSASLSHASECVAIARKFELHARSVLPSSKYKAAEKIIVISLSAALSSDKEEDKEIYFSEANLFIESILMELSHFKYVGSAFLVTILMIFPPLMYFHFNGKCDVYQILVGASLGAVGSWLSVIQRFHSVTVPRYSTWRYTFLRATSRIAIGYIFGAAFMLFQKAGIVLNLLNTNTFLIYSLAFASGLSERLIPDLVSQIEKNAKSI